ncbi:ParB/RepB/Spo0J family partition protein [Iodobacter fluviatilis]|nr:transcriptional repressor KorB C-terminal beta-barrel domain-containing protein [Iodobacter fluviatilis]
MVEIEKIIPDPENPRTEIDWEYIKSLALDIKTVGLTQPIVLRPLDDGNFLLRVGFCRYLAHKDILKETAIAATIEIHEINDFAQVSENEKRKGLSLLDMARFVQKKLGEGLTAKVVAAQLGIDAGEVSYYKTIINAPDCVMQAYKDGRTSTVKYVYTLCKLYEENSEIVEAWLASDVVIKKPTLDALRDSIKGKKPEGNGDKTEAQQQKGKGDKTEAQQQEGNGDKTGGQQQEGNGDKTGGQQQEGNGDKNEAQQQKGKGDKTEAQQQEGNGDKTGGQQQEGNGDKNEAQQQEGNGDKNEAQQQEGNGDKTEAQQQEGNGDKTEAQQQEGNGDKTEAQQQEGNGDFKVTGFADQTKKTNLPYHNPNNEKEAKTEGLDKYKNPVMLVSVGGLEAMLLLKRKADFGRVWVKFEISGEEVEINVAEMTVEGVIEGN